MPYETNPLDHLAFHGKPDSGLFLGVELEVECKGSASPGDKAEDWRGEAEDWLICKHDGSLNHGFEIVTAPSDLPTHVERWTALLGDSGLVDGLKSWNTSTCGLHVHVSRAPISALTLGKILVFMNHPSNRKAIVELAGRSDAHWCKFKDKKVTDSVERSTYDGKLRKSYGPDRYEAVNLRNDATIEFRIFKGTLKLEHVLANIEFCDAVVRWCMQNSIQDCDKWAKFWAFVEKHGKTYKHLINYLTEE